MFVEIGATPAVPTRESARFMQISDLHSMNGGAQFYAGAVSDRLNETINMAMLIDPAPDAVLLTGDLVNNMDNRGYGEVLEFAETLEQALGCLVIPVMGNHDDPAQFESFFGVLPPTAQRRPGDRHDHVRTIAGVRLIVLDSSVPERSYGELSEQQLDWLSRVLSVPSDRGTMLVMHHPPVASPMPQLRYAGLRNASQLATALAGSDVRAIITGHYHHVSATWWHDRLVWCGPALAYAQDVVAVHPRIRGWNHGYFSIIDADDHTISAAVVEIPNKSLESVLDYQLDLSIKASQWYEGSGNVAAPEPVTTKEEREVPS